MNSLLKYSNIYNAPLKKLDNLPKSSRIENSEKLTKKMSEGSTSFRVGGLAGLLKSNYNSATSNKGIEAFSTVNSSRQEDTLPRIISRNDIKKKLRVFEKKYNKSSDKFYSDWKQGKAIDNLDTLKWATYYEMWQNKNFM